MTEREAFEKYCFEVLLMSPSDGHFEREPEDYGFYESVNTHRLWKLWQAKAIPDGFVVVPVSASEKTKQKMLKVFNESDKFLNCENMYKAMIEAQEQTHD